MDGTGRRCTFLLGVGLFSEAGRSSIGNAIGVLFSLVDPLQNPWICFCSGGCLSRIEIVPWDWILNHHLARTFSNLGVNIFGSLFPSLLSKSKEIRPYDRGLA